MALIQKIRQKSSLVLILMILAIVSFIAMLITQDSNRNWGDFSSTSIVAKVAGQSLENVDLERRMAVLERLYGSRQDNTLRNIAVSMFVDNALMKQEAEKMGFGVSKDELLDLQFGPNPSQFITRMPGLNDPKQLQSIKQAIQTNTLPAETKILWAEIENQVIQDRMQSKLNNVVSKAVYQPTWLLEDSYKELTNPVTFEYVKIPFTSIDDKEATVTDADYEAYMKNNKGRFINDDEEGRSVEFVQFPVIPTSQDSMKVYDKIAALAEPFRTTTKDSAFVIANGGTYTDTWVAKDGLVPSVKDSLYTSPIGKVMGPFVESKNYWLAKLIDRKSAPDSVKSRHILIKTGNAQQIADSLKTILEGNIALWDSLNMKYSEEGDFTKLKGGDLGYQPQGTFVAEFNDLLFFKATQGRLYTVATQFGVHLVQVTGIKAGKNESRVKVAYIRQPIVPGPETEKKAQIAADELLATSSNLEELKKNAAAKGLPMLPSPMFTANDPKGVGVLGTDEGTRALMRWAFEAKEGERSKTVYALREANDSYNNRYVVAGMKQILPLGALPLKTVKENITPQVKNIKKGEIIKSKINSSDLNAIAAQFGSKVDTATGVTFNVNFIPNIGNEQRVLATAFGTAEGQVSKPIVGELAVYVVKVVKKETIANTPINQESLRAQALSEIKNRIAQPDQRSGRTMLMRALYKHDGVVDNRLKFY
jgi:peptidyl-prolyl cis-trans isomerase D